jgi:transposase
MSMRPQSIAPIPEETVRVARAAFPHGNLYVTMRDQLGTLYEDQEFAALFPKRGRPAEAPWQVALVCVFQFIEGLSDRQAAEAVRSRIDLKYALSLDLTDPGFDFSVLSKFRTRLIAGSAEMRLLETMLEQFRAQGFLKARGKQRTASTHVLAAIRTLNRLECVLARSSSPQYRCALPLRQDTRSFPHHRPPRLLPLCSPDPCPG